MSYDERLAIEAEQATRKLILRFFDGDQVKANLWFNTPNFLLGDIPPKDYIDAGRTEKLYQIVKHALWENKSLTS